jgi:SpoU rRNA Methylase family
MFGTACLFHDRAGLARAWQGDPPLSLVSSAELSTRYAPLIACDNLPGAADVYGFRTAPGPRPALVVGNERRGLAHGVRALATQAVQIPMFARTSLNCLNVAAAAAEALYHLAHGGGGKLQRSAHPERRRPTLMLVGGRDHVELGSTVRSAGAFGWEPILLDDRAGVWFGCERVTRSEGRAAARRGRNPIHLVPVIGGGRAAYDEVCVVTLGRGDTPLHRAGLAGGLRQLVVIPDECDAPLPDGEWMRLGKRVRRVQIDVSGGEFAYHYRLAASIALAKIARQVGQRRRVEVGPPVRGKVGYDRALAVLAQEGGELVDLEDLGEY